MLSYFRTVSQAGPHQCRGSEETDDSLRQGGKATGSTGDRCGEN